jgi:flagellar biosynthesis GTPase FlhF
MQVKKFEAPTLQECLDTIKRELGPEAIILQTKQNRAGFGLMSKGSVEVTAAVSERALDKKKVVQKQLPDAYNQKMNGMNATKQADFYENYLDKKIEKEKVQLSTKAANEKRLTAIRYADIQDDAHSRTTNSTFETTENSPAIPQYSAPKHVENAIENYSNVKNETLSALQEEVANLKRLVEDIRRERKKPEYID